MNLETIVSHWNVMGLVCLIIGLNRKSDFAVRIWIVLAVICWANGLLVGMSATTRKWIVCGTLFLICFLAWKKFQEYR